MLVKVGRVETATVSARLDTEDPAFALDPESRGHPGITNDRRPARMVRSTILTLAVIPAIHPGAGSGDPANDNREVAPSVPPVVTRAAPFGSSAW
ncbi:MAG: hypothetical protein AB7N73_08400 [Gemmatimonadales bacterium]